MADGSLEFIKAYYRMVRRVQPMSRLMLGWDGYLLV